MKILEAQSAVLSNYEVLSHLTTTRSKPRTTPQKHQNVETVLKEITDYFSPPTPESRSPLPPYVSPHYTPTTVRALVTQLQPYNLTKSEVLMILNLRPEELGLLDCVIEECDERFTAEQQEEILEIIGSCLGRSGRKVNGEEGREAQDAGKGS